MKVLLCAIGSLIVIMLMSSFAVRDGQVEPVADMTVFAMEPMEIASAPEPIVLEQKADVEQTPTPTEDPVEEPEEVPTETVEVAAEEVDDSEVELLACLMYQEAGGDACSDDCRRMVGDTALNRVSDPRFPNTLEEVLTQKGQYGEWYWTGIKWPERANYPGEAEAVERAYDIARSILEGNHSSIYGQGYIWEAEFSQGKDVIEIDGLYFGR